MKMRNYVLVTAGYWAFTLTDGALRMLVLLHFHELGYSPVAIAFLFLAYEFMGILTNLLGGWVGSRTGLNRTLTAGLGLQIVALLALTFTRPTWHDWVTVTFVMAAQALSGIAKDLTKMSSKSAVKAISGAGAKGGGEEGALFRLVAILTGSKNALKGVGFFLGATLLSVLGYDNSLYAMAALLAVTLVALLVLLDEDIGKSKKKAPLRSILSKSTAINRLSAARFFLFGSRDVWFVVALPVFLHEQLDWSNYAIGAFLALWTIDYGGVQSIAPKLLRRAGRPLDEIHAAQRWALLLAFVSAAIAVTVAADVAVTVAKVYSHTFILPPLDFSLKKLFFICELHRAVKVELDVAVRSCILLHGSSKGQHGVAVHDAQSRLVHHIGVHGIRHAKLVYPLKQVFGGFWG